MVEETDQRRASLISQTLGLATDIVSAYVTHNALPSSEIGSLIALVHASISALPTANTAQEPETAQEAAVSIKKSVTHEFIICLEDGKKFKSLKRHLASAYGMTPSQYRAKWNLPPKFPMVAPAYSAQRSSLAKKSGLGMKQKLAAKTVDTPRKVSKRGASH